MERTVEYAKKVLNWIREVNNLTIKYELYFTLHCTGGWTEDDATYRGIDVEEKQ